MEPQVEPIKFNIDTESLPPDIKDAVVHIQEVAEKVLYRWKDFPILLPASVTETQLGEGAAETGVISFKDLFQSPTFDELEVVARDSQGHLKRLNDQQLISIRQTGEFEVKSESFPGQVHRWRLSLLLQKGTGRAQDSLLNDMALALRLLIITARNRLHSHFFSLSQSLFAIKQGLWQLVDMLVGLPSTTPGSLYRNLHEEHSRFLVAELNVMTAFGRDWINFCEYIKEKCNPEEEIDKSKTTELRPPPVPHKFLTPKGADIDLRLFNRDLMTKCTESLKKILDKESKGWYIKYKDRLITELKGQNLSFEEITRHVNKCITEEYRRRVFQTIQISDTLEELQSGIGNLLVEQATSALAMNKALENMRDKLEHHVEQHKKLLITTYPVRSRIAAWMNERLQEFKEEFVRQNQWVPHEDSLQECRHQGLEQAMYFLHRDLIFLRDREAVLRKELSRVQDPNRVFTFATRIWLPSNYVVRRHVYGESEVIPTVISDAPAPDGQNYSNTLRFTVDKYVERQTSTQYPMWRWVNYFHRTWAWTWNAMFWLGLVVPWCSPVGLRALFSPRPFTPDRIQSQANGALYPRASSLTHTLVSRLRRLWAHVRLSREHFESEPDMGFLGKSCVRHLNRLWNYVLKGAVGSTCLVLGMVPLCLGVSAASVVAAVTVPVWMPVVTLCGHISSFLVYDYDHPVGNPVLYVFEAVLYRLVIQGCLQPVCAVIAALVLLPGASFMVLMVGVLRRCGRAVWDAFMYHAVVTRRGRVPCNNSFVAKRIEGPGLASNYFFQVKPAQALAAVEACLERHELDAWNENISNYIKKPLHNYSQFVKQVFEPFSACLEHSGEYSNLVTQTNGILSDLGRATQDRRNRLGTGLSEDIRVRIKLTARELKVTVTQTAKILESFYPARVLPWLEASEEEFWEGKHLEHSDWQGLATQVLTEVFSSSFLTPLEDSDTCFRLEVDHLNLTRYLDMLTSAEFRDDLDVVNTVHTPKGDIDVDAPYMDVCLFSPFKERIDYESTFLMKQRRRVRQRPWKKQTIQLKEVEKLEVPLPIATPAVICVLIHNRDNDQEPLDLEDATCYKIFKAVDQAAYSEPRSTLTDEYEASTPDHLTASEPDLPPSHLADPETSPFSSPDSPPGVPQIDDELAPSQSSLYTDGDDEQFDTERDDQSEQSEGLIPDVV